MKEILKRKKPLWWCSSIFILFVILFAGNATVLSVKAADTEVVIQEIDYDKELLTIKVNGDTKVFFSDSKQKTWEQVHGTIKNNQITMDISWVTKTRDNVITFKGDVSKKVVSITIPKQKTNFKVKINYIDNSIIYTADDGRAIEWRKDKTVVWNTTGNSNAQNALLLAELDRYYTKGAGIYFRLQQVKGGMTGPGGTFQAGLRPSKEVKISVSRKAAGPVVTIDGSAMNLTVKSTMVYRTFGETAWKDISSSITKLTIANAAPSVLATSSAKGSDVVLEFKTKGTSTKVESRISKLTIPGQEMGPQNVEFAYVGSGNISITIPKKTIGADEIPSASKSNPYEYTVVKDGGTYDPAKAKWTAITSSAAVKVSAKNAPLNSTIYVRMKTYKSGDIFRLASAAVSKKIEGYPSAATLSINAATDYIKMDTTGKIVQMKKVAGVPLTNEFTFVINNSSDINTDVSSVICKSTFIPFTTTTNGNSITVTLTGTEKLESATSLRGAEMPVVINLENGDQITDLATITLLEGSKFEKVYNYEITQGATKPDDAATKYKMNLIFGVTINGGYTSIVPGATTVTCGGHDVLSTIKISDDAREVEITLDYDKLQTLFLDSTIKLNEKVPIIVQTTNGAKVEIGASVILKEIASIDGGPITFIKKVGSNIEDNLVLDLKYTGDILVRSITWNGIDIMGNCSKTAKGITVELDKVKINGLNLSGSDTILTKDILITFDNGAVVNRGFTLILQK